MVRDEVGKIVHSQKTLNAVSKQLAISMEKSSKNGDS